MLSQWNRFWFAARDPAPLHAVRMLLGIVMLAWLIPLAGHESELFGLTGWLDRQGLVELSRLPEPPPNLLNWSPIYVAASPLAIEVFYWGTIAIAGLLVLGVAPRLVAPLAWLAVVSFSTRPIAPYGGDVLLLVLSFYVMVGYLLMGLGNGPRTARNWAFGPSLQFPFGTSTASKSSPTVSAGANLAIRMLQVHMAILVASAALHKLQIPAWWAGVALWFPMHPAFENSLEQVVAWKDSINPDWLLTLLSLATYGVLAWQFTFPLLIWNRRMQPIYIAGAILGCFGLWFIYHMPIFGPALLVGTLAFLPAEAWRSVRFAGIKQTAPAKSRTPERELAESAA